MSFIAFAAFCLVLLLAAYTVVRARIRKFTCSEVVSHVKPVSDQAREPETLEEFIAMYRAANNLTWLTMLADRYRWAMTACTDRYSFENMKLVHDTFQRKRIILLKSLVCGVFRMCIGDNVRARVTIAKHYNDVMLLAQEMVELIDPRCAALLESGILHGS